MNVILLSSFIFSLQLTQFEKRALNVCAIYGREHRESLVYLCGCAKQLRIYNKKIYEVCKK
jgi:hypothetical protein